MMFEITMEDIDNVLYDLYKFQSTEAQQEYIIMEIIEMYSLDDIVISVDDLEEQTKLVYAELKKQIQEKINEIDFIIPLIIQKKLSCF